MSRNLALSAVAGGLMSLAAALAVAQDAAVLDDLYGRGVHAYFSRDSRKAVQLLSEAIDNGSQDPRAFYFRGLALRSLGREEDAAIDFKDGAKLEQAGVEMIDVVSKSLERVQGGVRLDIENHRRLGRLKTRNERLAREKQRYEDITAEDERVLRKPAATRPAAPRPRAVVPEAVPPEASDPFGEERPVKPAPPAEPTEPAEGPPPKPEATEESTEPAEEPPPKPKPAAADPFSEDPLGEEPPAKPAAPPAEKAEPEEEPPAKPKPAVEPAEDPFSEDAPEEKPAAKSADEPAAEEKAPEAAAVAPPATRPVTASRSLFGALSRAIIGGEGSAKSEKKAAPAIDLSNAKDPFAEDEAAPASVKATPASVKTPAAAPEIDDPFKE